MLGKVISTATWKTINQCFGIKSVATNKTVGVSQFFLAHCWPLVKKTMFGSLLHYISALNCEQMWLLGDLWIKPSYSFTFFCINKPEPATWKWNAFVFAVFFFCLIRIILKYTTSKTFAFLSCQKTGFDYDIRAHRWLGSSLAQSSLTNLLWYFPLLFPRHGFKLPFTVMWTSLLRLRPWAKRLLSFLFKSMQLN